MPSDVKEYRFTPLAIADLEDIWRYTAETWSPEQADIYHRKIMTRLDKLARGEVVGRNCDDVRPGYFRLKAELHVVFFRHRSEFLEIVRILHQSMDLPRHL